MTGPFFLRRLGQAFYTAHELSTTAIFPARTPKESCGASMAPPFAEGVSQMVTNYRDCQMTHWYNIAKGKLALGKKDEGLRVLFALRHHLHQAKEPSRAEQLKQLVDDLCSVWGCGFDWE